MKEADLKELIPAYGDRISLMNFAQRSTSTSKESLIERLKRKMEKRTHRPSRENNLKNYSLNKKRDKRLITIGWLHWHIKHSRYMQVRSQSGGGNRKQSINKSSKSSEVLIMAKLLFFPNGMSPKGPITNFEIELVDFKMHSFNQDLTIEEMFQYACLPVLRFYIATRSKSGSIESEDDFLPSPYIRSLQTSTTRSTRLSERLALPAMVTSSVTSDFESTIDENDADSLLSTMSGIQEQHNEGTAANYLSNFDSVSSSK